MKIRTVFFQVFICAALGLATVAFAADRTPQEKFADAVALLESRKFAEAVPILDDLSASYPTAAVFWNLGLSAAELGNYAKAKQAWLAYRSVVPGNWQVQAKLIQAYQALGDFEARDNERASLVRLWKDGTDAKLSAQTVFCREQFWLNGRKVMVLEYFNPSGPAMVVYSFLALNDAGRQDFKISLGSYDITNQIALELGQRPKDKRIYHLDLYRPNAHETYGMFLGQPGYDEIRGAVVDILSGKRKPSSSSTG